MTRGSGNGVDQDALRLRLQEAMVAAGVNQGRVALEVLYWLPKEFMEAYQELYYRALHLGDGDDQEKAGEDEGRIKAKVPSKLRGTKRGLSAQGGGKKYKREWVVKDEQALEVKKRVDRVLRGLVEREKKMVGESHGDRPGVGESHGSTPGVWKIIGQGTKARRACRECGRIASSDWARCPFPH